MAGRDGASQNCPRPAQTASNFLVYAKEGETGIGLPSLSAEIPRLAVKTKQMEARLKVRSGRIVLKKSVTALMARLDRLGPMRRVAQIGAAIGREFPHALVRVVSQPPEDELQDSLARLVASELVFQRGTPPDAVYSFKHALVQDVAHGSLLHSFRQQLHAQIAAALETYSPEIIENQPELFAQHYAEAGLVEKSVACWGKAGYRSADRSAMAEAAAQFEKALGQLALLPDTPERQRQGARILQYPWPGLERRQRPCGAGDRSCSCPRPRAVGAARFSLRVPSHALETLRISYAPRRTRFGAALGRGLAASEPSAERIPLA